MKIATMTVKSDRDKRHMSVYIRRQSRKQKQVKKSFVDWNNEKRDDNKQNHGFFTFYKTVLIFI